MRVETTLTIKAKPQAVWEVLTDLERWSEWNPHIFDASGKPAVGEKLDLTMWQGEPAASAAKNKTQRFKPTVITSIQNSQLAWQGRLAGIPGLFTGLHSFELVEVGGGTQLIHSEQFSGILVRPFAKMLAHLPHTFSLVNEKLAARVEAKIDSQAVGGGT